MENSVVGQFESNSLTIIHTFKPRRADVAFERVYRVFAAVSRGHSVPRRAAESGPRMSDDAMSALLIIHA